MRTFTSVDELEAAVGESLGHTDWLEITQERVDLFAEATGDFQWIHVDVERAAAGPFGGTIAHGYLTLSLVSQFMAQLFVLDTPGAKINYGSNKVRFVNPVRVGRRIRLTGQVAKVEHLASGHQLTLACTIEIEGEDRPAMVAEILTLLL
jgi:acyl dehydratase